MKAGMFVGSSDQIRQAKTLFLASEKPGNIKQDMDMEAIISKD